MLPEKMIDGDGGELPARVPDVCEEQLDMWALPQDLQDQWVAMGGLTSRIHQNEVVGYGVCLMTLAGCTSAFCSLIRIWSAEKGISPFQQHWK